MAKKKHGQFNSPRSSSPPHHSGLLSCPSLSVLSILSTIAAASQAVDGSPLPLPTPPPPFLCPFIEHDRRVLISTVASSSTVTSASSTPSHHRKPQVADKYVQGQDGLWRKTDNWTLFGSTYSLTASQTTAPTTVSQFDLLDSVLPAGWSPTSSSGDRTESIIILSLAIVLAVSICVFMIGCIFWRRRRKKLLKMEKSMSDVELKTRHKENVDDPSEDEREREVHGKLRVWAEASARWKKKIKHSARRRKNRRHALSTTRLSRPQSPCQASISPSSPPSSRRHSMASISEDLHTATALSPENSSIVAQPSPSPVPSSPHRVSSPPAYMFPAQRMHPMTEDCLQVSHENSGGDSSSRKPLLYDVHNLPPPAEDDEIRYQPNYAGHVAIDDKAHLARMAGLASAPPATTESTDGSSSESAPEWYDDPEELHFPCTTTTPPVSILGFPSPPPKSIFSSRYFDGHSYLEDITALDPITLPSMPPYEAGPSAAPFEEVLHASAPPLSDDDQTYEHWGSSASEASDGECKTPTTSSPALPDQAHVGRHVALPIYQP